MIDKIDAWFLLRIRLASQWIFEWLSVSQKTQEKCLIGIFLVVGTFAERYSPYHSKWDYVFLSIMFLCMWSDHRKTDSERQTFTSGYFSYFRIIWFVLAVFGWIFLLLESFRRVDNGTLLSAIKDTDLGLFFYLVSIATGEERGKKRQAALAKAKEMFGNSWIVAPLPQVR